jgi:HAE1 family hydrophobic/amphiphilic exporter-1/multidrug efflux pump
MGTGVFGGMFVATFVATLFIPLFFTLLGRRKAKRDEAAAAAQEGAV